MHTFLSKISQLDSIHDVILLSPDGELLFARSADASREIGREVVHWNLIIAGLARPLASELVFEAGRYYLHDTALGYVIVGMTTTRNLGKVRTACMSVREKLADSAVRKRVVLKMLADADESVKPRFIKALVSLADGEVASVLTALLRKEAQFTAQHREKLLLSICEALGHCSSHEALEALNEFLAKYAAAQDPLPVAVETAARISVQQLMLDMPVAKIAAEAEKKEKNFNSGSGNASRSDTNDNRLGEQQRIEELLGSGKQREAISFIMQAIETAAGVKQFDEAERLRDWLIKIDSMSLREIIRAAEIIEEGKRASIDSEHLAIWKDLVDALSPEEFSALYHATTPKNYADGEMVVKQGEFLSSLFFIDSGRVQLYAVSEGREVPLKIVGPGEIIGSVTFFEISVWTVNARSMGAELKVLTREKLQGQKEAYPALHSKLMDYCARFQSANALFSRTRRTRRLFERKKVSGRATIILLDEKGNETGIGAKGDLLDISLGGLSFSLRFSKKKNAAALLGKKIRVNIHSDTSPTSFSCNALVMAVRCHDYVGNDYSLHVEFQKELNRMEMQQIAGRAK
jgi:CRP-like cAMP-binding protein